MRTHLTEGKLPFKGDMVRAILREIEQPGTGESMTSRIIKPPPKGFEGIDAIPERLQMSNRIFWWDGTDTKTVKSRGRYVGIHDFIWVRETWQQFFDNEIPVDRSRQIRGRMGIPAKPEMKSYVAYRADGDIPDHPEHGKARWRASIHMPRWASRITLVVTNSQIRRLHDISEEEAKAEGVRPACRPPWKEKVVSTPWYRWGFAELWDGIYGKNPGESWDDNPWILSTYFKPYLCNIDRMDSYLNSISVATKHGMDRQTNSMNSSIQL